MELHDRRVVKENGQVHYKSRNKGEHGENFEFMGVQLATSSSQSGKWHSCYSTFAQYMLLEFDIAIHLQSRLAKLEAQMELVMKENITLRAFYDAKMSWQECSTAQTSNDTQ